MRRTSPRGFTLLELMMTVAITGIMVGLAARGIILTNRGRQLREATATAQGSGRLGLAILQEDLRAASLGAGTGVIWTTSSPEGRRPAVQIYDSVGGGFLNAKPGTDALLVVRAAPAGDPASPTGSTVLAQDLMKNPAKPYSADPFRVTDATGLAAGDRVLVGEYDDAVFMPLKEVNKDARELRSALTADVFPGQFATKIPNGSLVRKARVRLYYVDTEDRLMQAELLVPYAPGQADLLGVRDIAQGIENMQLDCTLEAPGPCPGPGGKLSAESADALGPPDLGGARFDETNISNVRSITIRFSIRSKALHDQTEPGDPPIAIDGVSVVTPDGVHYARRGYEVGAAVRNVSLGAL